MERHSCPNCRRNIDIDQIQQLLNRSDEDDMGVNIFADGVEDNPNTLQIQLPNSDRPTTKKKFLEVLDLESGLISGLISSSEPCPEC